MPAILLRLLPKHLVAQPHWLCPRQLVDKRIAWHVGREQLRSRVSLVLSFSYWSFDMCMENGLSSQSVLYSWLR